MAVIGVVMAAMMHYSEAQTTHEVGGTIGWTVPTGGAATYTSWASGRQFVVGDTLGNILDDFSFSSSFSSFISTVWFSGVSMVLILNPNSINSNF